MVHKLACKDVQASTVVSKFGYELFGVMDSIVVALCHSLGEMLVSLIGRMFLLWKIF